MNSERVGSLELRVSMPVRAKLSGVGIDIIGSRIMDRTRCTASPGDEA